MQSLKKKESNEENLKRIFRSISAALTARNAFPNNQDKINTNTSQSKKRVIERGESETRYCKSRLWLIKIQQDEQLKKKNKRGHSISLKSLQRERYNAKMLRQSSNANYSQERDMQVLNDFQNHSMTVDNQVRIYTKNLTFNIFFRDSRLTIQERLDLEGSQRIMTQCKN